MSVKQVDIDINSPRVREIVQENTLVFEQAFNALLLASQFPTATEEENVALVLRGAVAYASGICRTFNIKPEGFARLMHLFMDEAGIPNQHAPKLKG